ncbi:hypothetical protein N9T52_00295 [bacterium]|nr:hypothetical protein [bacterium]
MATAYEIQVTEAYIGLLGRAPDPAGLAYWVGQLGAAVTAGQDATFALKKLTNDIALSAEWTGGLGVNDATTTAGANAVVEGMYQNLFERAATAADLAYWTPQLTGGSTTASEMALNLITAAKGNTAKPTDGEVLGYKQQAATYYVESVSQEKYSVSSANNAVKDVNGPTTLNDSKTATDFVKSGVGVTTDLADVGAGNDVTMTATADVVTGTVGTGATYSTQNISDVTVGDNDTVTLSGDAGFTLDDVTNIENLNINLSDSLGGGFTVNATNALASTINFDVTETFVTSNNVTLTGETTASVTGLSTSNLNTTDVTNLTVGIGGGASAISADNDAATVQINGIDANDTTLTLSATTVDLDLDGTTGTSDTIAVSAKGAVSLDASDTDLVEKISLSGNGAAATFTVTGVTATTNMVYGVTGDQNVTLAGTGAMFTTTDFSDTSTAGTTALKLSSSGAAAVDVSTWGALSGGVELSGAYDAGTETLMVASGSTVKISADQSQTINFDTNDGTTGSSLTLDIDNDTAAITTADIDTLTVNTGDMALIIAGALNAGDNDATLAIAGTNDVTINAAVSGGDISWVSLDATVAGGGIDADGDLTITATNDISVTGAITADNDVVMSGNDINIATGLSTAASSATDGSVSLTSTGATGNVDLAGTITVDNNLTVVSGFDTSSGGAIAVENDISITSGGDVTLAVVGTTAAGSDADLVIAATNDVNLNGAVTVKGDITVTNSLPALTAASIIDASGIALTADNDITITGTDTVIVDTLATTVGSVTIEAGNDITVGTSAASDINFGSLTLKSLSASEDANKGVITLDESVVVDNDVTITGAKFEQAAGGALTSRKGNISITMTNDVTGTENIEATTGNVTIAVTGANGADVAFAAADVITAANDVTVSGDDVAVGVMTSSDTGNITVTGANDVAVQGNVTSNTDGGNITITSSEAFADGAKAITATAGITIDADNDVTITAASGGEIQLNNAIILSSNAGNIKITGGDIDGTGAITATKGDIELNSTCDATETATLSGDITATNGKVSILGGNFAIGGAGADIISNVGGITIGGDAQGSFGDVTATGSSVRVESSNSTQGVTGDVIFTTIDSPVVLAQGAGDYTLGTVASSTGNVVTVTTGGGNDSVTLNSTTDVYTVNMNDGADTVINTQSVAGSTINTGGGDDTYTPTAGQALATVDMGAGTGDKVTFNGDHKTDGSITNYEILNVGGAVTLSEAQIDNDATFEIQGANSTITVATVASVNLSGVDFQAGNTTKFVISGLNAGSSFTGSDGVDEFTGGTGVDSATLGLGADLFVASTGADTVNFGSDTGADKYDINAVASSAASVAANTTRTFDAITQFDTGEDKIDIAGVNTALTGAGAAGAIAIVSTLTTAGGSMNDTTIATFAELKVAVDAVGLTASAAGGLKAHIIDLTGNTGALGTGKYLVINNNDTAITAADILIEITGTDTPVAGDFILA